MFGYYNIMSIWSCQYFLFGVNTMLSDRLIQLKNERNILQKDIAASLNISLRSYQRYEKGERNPDSLTLTAMADFFGVSIDYLVGRTDKPEINR